MPKVSVLWSREAEDSLTRLWIDHPRLRNAITAAASAIDRQLEEDAQRFAVESRTEEEDTGRFAVESRAVVWAVGLEPPLGVEFVLGNPIIVVRVWLVKPPRRRAD
jgi:hypothetical protein